MISANSSSRNRSPFTATQWQELEHQALIFKYMVSGVPIPPDLIYSVKRSLDSASFSSRLFSHHPSGWGCFEMGFGRKVDPEPGRCRRTDGKKWRCSKEAYPDSKYCERHMHRGRNRSRKHVEVSSSSSSPSQPQQSQSSSSSSSSSTSSLLSSTNLSAATVSLSQQATHAHGNLSAIYQTHSQSQLPSSTCSSSVLSVSEQSSLYSSFGYPDSSSSRPPDHHHHHQRHHHYGLSSQPNTSPYFCLKSEPYNTSPQSDKDYMYFQGAKESMDELAFFPESARGFTDSSSCHPLMSYNRGYNTQPQTQYQALTVTDTSKEVIKQQSAAEDQQHCFILGTDFKSDRSNKAASSVKEQTHETQKPLHHFFGEWPPKNTAADSWLDLASNSRVPNDG